MGALGSADADRYAAWVDRRARGEPVAYITGRQAFLGLELLMDRRALVVRSMTGVVTQLALELARARGGSGVRAADVGTGSGAVAVALAVLEPSIGRVYATDIDAGALGLAQENVRRYALAERVRLLLGDLLQPVPEPVDLVVANLPYVPVAERAVLDTGFEPAAAFDGGPDGLDLIRRFAEQMPGRLTPGGGLVLEVGPGQRAAVESLLRAAVPDLRFTSPSGASWAPHVVVGIRSIERGGRHVVAG
jgi:release factor glutamine methyltransferase